MAEVLFEHLWNKQLTGEQLRATAKEAAADSQKIKWYSVIRPFDRIEPLAIVSAHWKRLSCGWRI